MSWVDQYFTTRAMFHQFRYSHKFTDITLHAFFQSQNTVKLKTNYFAWLYSLTCPHHCRLSSPGILMSPMTELQEMSVDGRS